MLLCYYNILLIKIIINICYHSCQRSDSIIRGYADSAGFADSKKELYFH